MKKIIGLFALSFISFVSYTNENVSEKIVPKGKTAIRESRCPDGTYEVWRFEFTDFNFRRPKFNCEKGFWFCFIDGEWVFEGCKDRLGMQWPANPSLTEKGGTLIAFPHKTENVVTILFPYGLVNKAGNKVEDFKVFNVDEEMSIGDMKLKKGDYPTKFVNNEIVIDVPFY